MSESLMNNNEVKGLITKVSGLANDAGRPADEAHHASVGIRPVPHH